MAARAEGPLAPGGALLADAPVIRVAAVKGEIGRLDAGLIPAFAESGENSRFTAVRVVMVGAAAFRIRIEGMRLAEEEKLYVYRLADGAPVDVQGPFTGGGPGLGGDFSLAVAGQEAIVEFQTSRNSPADLPFRIAEVEPVDGAGDAIALKPGSASETRAGYFRGSDLTYQVIDGLAVFEGDIVLGGAEEIEPARGKSGSREAIVVTGSRYRWPGGAIPYVIEGGLPNAYRVTDAVSHWNSATGGAVRLTPRTSEANYVVFTRPTDPGRCAANVGMQGNGQQYVYAGDYCSTGNLIHEIGHATGLWHEQSREDRNSYVVIRTANILSGTLSNFDQQIANGDDIADYDFGSIMHYGAYAFSSNGLPTIETIPAGVPIGQRSALSSRDIAGVRAIYGGTAPPPPPVAPQPVSFSVTFQSNPAGMPISVDGVVRNAPFTVSWTEGSTHAISALNAGAQADTRTVFVNWSSGGAQAQSVIASSSQTTFTANYSVQYRVTVTASPAGAGTATASPASADGFYALNTRLSLTATPSGSYCFTGWTGLIAGTSATANLTVTAPYAITANFGSGAVTLSDTYLQAKANGAGVMHVGVTSNSSCSWTAVSSASWLSVSQNSGAGNGRVQIRTDTNATGAPRTATISIANQTVTVYQP